jgi:hypothetical protein
MGPTSGRTDQVVARVESVMKTTIRLMVALMAAAAFTTAWAADKDCAENDAACREEAAQQEETAQQEESSQDWMTGSGSGEPTADSRSFSSDLHELYEEQRQHEYWSAGD